MRKYFGTDGIRGRANVAPMTAEMAMRLGMAAGAWFRRGAHRHRAVIGKDTRLSGYMLESALQAGFTSVGVDVILTGPMPTPAVGVFTRSLRADVGVMISASHNPYDDNGLKLFGPDGYKLSDEAEAEIEAMMDAPGALAPAEQIGRAWRVDDLGRYIELAKATFPRALGLEGLKIVVDCANGAAYKAAPMALWELGADVVPIGVAPDGLNINRGVGSTAPQVAQETVVLHGADLGVALDGDADRVHLIDENGALIDGDQIMALIARRWSRQGRLARNGLVTTVMSNLGMERLLAEEGVFTERTKVGDRYVVERMREGGFNLGGEQSGHIVLSDYTTTGDGLIAALQVLAALVEEGRPASEACRQFEPMPQVLKSVRFAGDDPLARERVKTAVADGEAALGDAGRIVIRRSGTEPLIRVMAEGEDEAAVATAVNAICAEIETGA